MESGTWEIPLGWHDLGEGNTLEKDGYLLRALQHIVVHEKERLLGRACLAGMTFFPLIKILI